MEPAGPAATGHPLVAVLGRLEQVLAEAGQVPVFTLDAGTTASTLQQLVVLQSRLAAVTLTVLAHGDQVDVAAASGAASTAAWFAHATRTTRPAAHRQARVAGSLADPTHACVAAAFAAGLLVEDQARVIIDAVDALPSTGEHAVTAQVIAEAEAHLVGLAAHHDARELRRLGLRLLEVVSPETADAYEAKKLQAQERRAAEQTRLTLSADGQGSVFVKGKIPDLHAAMLTKMLHAYAAPKHQAAQAAADGVPTPPRQPSPQRLGRAFCDLIETLAAHDHPQAGGTGATVVVTIDLATLTGSVRAGHLDTGQPISPGTARRLACQAGLIPAVLDGDSTPLDLGRTRRFHTRGQRIAIGLRDGGCTAQGCDWPPGMCHVHHDPPWTQGGTTDVEHARMLCPHHHARAHDPAYDTTRHPDRTITFHRRI